MRCNICDRLLSSPIFNRQLKAWEPCEQCLAVISECLNDFKDNAVWYEEDLPDSLEEAAHISLQEWQKTAYNENST